MGVHVGILPSTDSNNPTLPKDHRPTGQARIGLGPVGIWLIMFEHHQTPMLTSIIYRLQASSIWAGIPSRMDLLASGSNSEGDDYSTLSVQVNNGFTKEKYGIGHPTDPEGSSASTDTVKWNPASNVKVVMSIQAKKAVVLKAVVKPKTQGYASTESCSGLTANSFLWSTPRLVVPGRSVRLDRSGEQE